VVYV